jgi:MtN3 and saliva related transmembrane protein
MTTFQKPLAKLYEKYMMFIGIIGQLLFYLQALKIFRDRSAEDVSFPGFLLGLISVTSWLIYGVLIRDKVLVIANAFAVIGAILVLSGIMLYG